MLYTHAQDDAKQSALEKVSEVLFPNVPKLRPMEASASEKKILIQ
jgi:hypothetical protein